MLVITRKAGESIVIHGDDGERIVITITRVDRSSTRVGIDAPERFGIVRGEMGPVEHLKYEDEPTPATRREPVVIRRGWQGGEG